MISIRGVLLIALALGVACAAGPPPPAAQAPTGLAEGSFTADLDGVSIHYEVHGHGPVLMTLPNSWGLSLAGLRALYRPLEERLTMVYFDPRGMGSSGPVREEADMGMAAVRTDFDALRRHLGLEAVNVIGWSNGAMNLLLLAAERPDTVRTAIIVHGVASFTDEDNAAFAEKHPDLVAKWAALEKELADPALDDAERTARMRALWLGDWFPLSCADREGAPALLEKVFGEAQFSWRHADYAQRESPTFDARDLLPMITARCLVIAGAHDTLPPERVAELADALPNGTFVRFEHSGHFAPVEEPEAFRAAVFGFLGVGDSPVAGG